MWEEEFFFSPGFFFFEGERFFLFLLSAALSPSPPLNHLQRTNERVPSLIYHNHSN